MPPGPVAVTFTATEVNGVVAVPLIKQALLMLKPVGKFVAEQLVIAPPVEVAVCMANFPTVSTTVEGTYAITGAMSPTVIDNEASAEPPVLLTRITRFEIPNTVGVPVIEPFVFNVRPTGNVPENRVYVKFNWPPVTVGTLAVMAAFSV
jgi:hypothetical protein